MACNAPYPHLWPLFVKLSILKLSIKLLLYVRIYNLNQTEYIEIKYQIAVVRTYLHTLINCILYTCVGLTFSCQSSAYICYMDSGMTMHLLWRCKLNTITHYIP